MPKNERRSDWVEGLNSKKQEKENDRHFFAALDKDFLDFMFSEFCRVEEMKEFIRKFALGEKSEKPVHYEPNFLKLSDLILENPPKHSWLETVKLAVVEFVKSVSNAMQGVVNAAGNLINQHVLPQHQQAAIQAVKKAVAVPNVMNAMQNIFNGFQAVPAGKKPPVLAMPVNQFHPVPVAKHIQNAHLNANKAYQAHKHPNATQADLHRFMRCVAFLATSQELAHALFPADTNDQSRIKGLTNVFIGLQASNEAAADKVADSMSKMVTKLDAHPNNQGMARSISALLKIGAVSVAPSHELPTPFSRSPKPF